MTIIKRKIARVAVCVLSLLFLTSCCLPALRLGTITSYAASSDIGERPDGNPNDIIATQEAEETEDGDEVMVKALNKVAGLVIMAGIITIALGVFNLILGFGTQEPHRLMSAKIAIGAGITLTMIVPILKMLHVVA